MSYCLEKLLPALPRVERGKPIVLGDDPNGENILYTNGTYVLIRNLKNFCDNDSYAQHSVQVNVAKYSPSRFYIASADKNGKVRIWDTVQKEHILKNEFQPFAGPINDLAWTSDNQRIVVGGAGREKFGAVFNVETGASTGEIMGMGRPVNSVDFRSARPLRCITGSEDSGVCYFEGPPFKFKMSSQKHTNFVNVVRYSPTGAFFVTGGADGKIFEYAGETGEFITEVGDPAHTGGIYGLAFSTDGVRMVSVSGDKSMKLWSIEGPQIVELSQHHFGNDVKNILLGCAWVSDTIAVVSLGSGLHLFDAPSSITTLSAPKLTLQGHSKPITSAAFSSYSNRFLSASSDGSLASWDLSTGLATMFTGAEMHTSQIQAIQLNESQVITVGIDDRCVVSLLDSKSFVGSVKLPSQPRSLAVLANNNKRLALVACINHLVLVDTQETQQPRIVNQLSISSEPNTCAYSHSLEMAVIGFSDGRLICYTVVDSSVVELNSDALKINAAALVSAFSPNGQLLAIADADRTLSVYHVDGGNGDKPSLKQAVSDWWKLHTARITSLAWSPCGRRLATGSLDTSIVIWSLDSPKTKIQVQNAHPLSQITSLNWGDEHRLISTGQDAAVRCWRID